MLSRLSNPLLALTLIAGSSLMQACDTGSGSMISLGAIDSTTLLQGLVEPTTEGDVTPPPVDNPGSDIPSTVPVFTRVGLEGVLGYNYLSWTYSLGSIPTVDETFFFTDIDIGLDSSQRPLIAKTLDNAGGRVVVLYLELPEDPVNGILTFARVYSDRSVVVHLFQTFGESTATGDFVYCYPDEDIEACINGIDTAPDGRMRYTHSLTPIAATDTASGNLSNPTDVVAWMQYERQISAEAPRGTNANTTFDTSELIELINEALAH